MPPARSNVLNSLLLANTALELGCGAALLVAPRFLSGKHNDEKASWSGGAPVVAFGRAGMGCATLALGLSSLVAWMSTKPVSLSTVASLAFYHLAATVSIVPLLGFNKEELQYPAMIGHPLVGLGLAYYSVLGSEDDVEH